MRTEKAKIYTFDELSEKAKEFARMHYGDTCLDYEWWCGVYYDFIDDCKKYGLGVNYDDINFSGFCSQGDGASFTCDNIDIEKFIKYSGIKIRYGLPPIVISNTELTITRTDNMYYHENTVSSNYQYCYTGYHHIDAYLENIAEKLQDKLEDLKNTLCLKLYDELEGEYDWLLSDEHIDEELREYDFEFYENGKLYYNYSRG